VVAQENLIVHGLWVGSLLSKIELLTIHSFLKHGHQFHLWVYEKLENKLPDGVIVRDANEIIPKEKIFRRKFNDPSCGVGKGSVGSPFADWFRYKLLYEHGGWWTDMDITCLKPLDFADAYLFREHDKVSVIGNVMKVPRNSELMKITAQKVESQCNENTIDWLLPNKLLAESIQQLGLSGFIRKNISNRDIWQETEKFIFKNHSLPEEWYVIHWMNEEWRMRGIDKNNVSPDSTLGNLLYHYGMGKKTGYVKRLFALFLNR